MDCNETVVTHLRAGRADAVRAKPLLAQGRFRITYEITHSSSPVAQDMLLGVCDATAWSTGDDKDVSAHDMIEALFSEQKLKHSTFSKHGHAVAWGFDPKRGRVVSAPGITHGTYAGGQYGKALVDVDDLGRPRAPKLPPKTIVMVEVDLLELDEVNSDLFRRDFACSLHPLGMRGASKLDPSMGISPAAPGGRRTLSFSINGGELIDSGVSLPPAVFPWVMLTWEGDKITLVSVEKFAPKIK